MRIVWFVFKLMEAFLGITCLAIHIDGFLRVSVDSFVMTLLTFLVFPCHAMFGCLNICMNSSPTATSEAAANTVASITYFCIAINTMYYAEKEFYLMYLSELEQPLHPFFHYSKSQSITALVVGVLHMLHAVLAFDIVLFRPKPGHTYGEEDPTIITARQPLQLYLLGKSVQTHMEKYLWFRHLADKLRPGDLV